LKIRLSIFTLVWLFLAVSASADVVSLLTEKEKAWLRDHPEPIRVHNEMDWGPYNYNEDGQAKGHSIDYMNLVAQKLGLEVDYISGPNWDEFLDMMRDGSLDLMLNIANTKERRKFLAFSEPYLLTWTSLYVRNSEYEIKGLDDLSGKKIAFVKGFFFGEFIRKFYPEIEIITFDTSHDSFVAVNEGQVDAAMEVPVVAREILLAPELNNMKLGGRISDLNFIPTFNIAARKDVPILLGIIQKGMDAISIEEELSLRQKWNLEETEKSLFSIDEIGLLKQLDELFVCINPGRLPLEAMNIDGTMSGISSEFVNLLHAQMQTPFSIVATQNWASSLSRAEQGECDFLPMIVRTKERERYLNFTSPWLSRPLVMVTGHDQIYVHSIDQVIDKKIGIVRGLAIKDLLLASNSNTKLVEVENVSEGLEKVKNGDLFGFVDTIPTISRILQANAISEVKISGNIGLNIDYSIGIPKDNHRLLSILEKTIGTIDKKEISKIYNRWLAVTYIERFDYTRLWQVIFVGFLIGIFVFYRYRRGLELTTELKKAKHSAEEANRIKSRFLTAAGHDLRQPIHAISLFLGALQNKLHKQETVKLASKIEISLSSLSRMLDGLLDMSRLENHAIAPQFQDFPAQVILDEIKAELTSSAVTKNLKLTIIPSSLILNSDQTLLSRIIGNFVSNAIRYTDEGRVLIGCRNCGDMVRLEVWDSGKGMPEEDLDSIFDPYQRLEGTRTHAAEGLGLGLAISDGLANLLGHPLIVRSTVGEGSLFAVEVPKGSGELVMNSEEITSQFYTKSFQGIKVLVLDDDLTVVDGMEAILSGWGCDVSAAYNVSDALKIARELQDSLDIIISDYNLSDNNTGVQFLADINQTLDRKVPAIIVSGDTQPERRREVEAAGYCFLTKPIQPVSLRPLLNRLLRSKSG